MKHLSLTLPVIVLIFFNIAINNRTYAQNEDHIKLTWLGESEPSIASGVSWGVPFSEGKIKSLNQFELTDDGGNQLPLQSWKLAYWPDGSYKWVGFSTVVSSKSGTVFNLKSNKKTEKQNPFTKLSISENEESIHIDTGVLQGIISKSGNKIFSSLIVDGKEISSGSQLICIIQNGPEKEIGVQPAKEKFVGNISKVTVEQKGPVRSVIKLEGYHKSELGEREWLPFIVRLYFYAGQQSVKLIHTIIYDGEQEQDFIRGLGITFDIPLNEETYNRHIRFSGENNGLWDEPIQPLIGRGRLSYKGEDYYSAQLKGERIPNRDTFSSKQQFLL
ncbi:MAG TPA: hypothetical protein VKN14_04945, partial [Flavobacteriaceae bacterium]|nr:hypothetical protein [Flavobacteriaceae bacterium]